MLELITTRYGNPAAEALHARIVHAKTDDPLAAVTVVVPDNAVAVAARRSIALGSHGPVHPGTQGLAGVTFVTIFRLAERLGARDLASAGRRPLSTPVIAAAVRQVLSRQPGVFGEVAGHPTTEKRLVRAYRELADLDVEALAQLARSPLARVRDVVRIHRSARAILAPRWYDEQDLVEAALARLDSPAVVAGDMADADNTMIVYLPRDLSPPRARLLRRLGERRPIEIIVALTGIEDADRPARLVLERLDLTDDVGISGAMVVEPALDVFSASDPDDEVRNIVRAVVRAARAGTPFDRMAIVHSAEVPYGHLLHDHLAAAGIPVNGPTPLTLGESVAGRTLRRWLGIADRGFRRDDVIGLVASSPLSFHGRRAPSRVWDRISREAGVVRGLQDWTDRLHRWSSDARRELAEISDDPHWAPRVRRLEREIEQADGLNSFVVGIGAALQEMAGNQSWTERARWCQELLRHHLEDPSDWPEAERRARDRVDAVLGRLASLDSVDGAPTLAVFRRTLDLELDTGALRSGSFGSGLFVGDPRSVISLDISELWVVGLAEGTFPSRPRDDSLIPDREREGIVGLTSSRARTDAQHVSYLGALSAVGAGTAHLSWPRGDLRRAEHRTPSRWLLDTIGERLGRVIGADDIEHIDGWIHHIPSHTAGLIASDQVSTAQEYDITRLLALNAVNGDIAELAEVRLARNAALLVKRNSSILTRYDGIVGPRDGPGNPTLTNQPMSATSLESYSRCPFHYFVRHVLGVEQLDAPERRLRIDAMERGRLVHRILERFVAEIADRSGSWQDLRRSRLGEITEEEFALALARGVTGAELYWRRDQVLIRRDLDAYFRIDLAQREAHRLRPAATELAFGLRGTDPITVVLPDHRTLRLRGSIDLVDRGDDDGRLVVTDYKTGRITRVSEADPHQGGTKLQLVLYAIAARILLESNSDVAVESRYWHLNAAANYESTGYVVSPDIETNVLGAVTMIVDLIGSGMFPQRPEESTRLNWVPCPSCDPDGLGVAEARRRFDRMSDDPTMAPYMALVQPDRLGLADPSEAEEPQ